MIEKAMNTDLGEIAKVHTKCFPGYFLSKYGEKLLARYYGEYLAEGVPFVIARENGSIVGFCMGYIGQTEAKKKFLHKNFFGMAGKTLKFMLTFDKEVYSRIKTNILPSRGNDNSEIEGEDEAYLLSICVVEEKRGTGLSRELMEAFEGQLIEKGCKEYVLFAIEDNDRGIGFYEKMGFEEIRSKDGSIKFRKTLQSN